jgi:hypothetical protein
MTRTGVPNIEISRHGRDATRRPPVRLRQRRLMVTRLLIVGVGLMLVPAVAFAFTASPHAHAVRVSSPARTIVVGQDDTLWDLALAYAPPNQDPVAYLTEVIALNDVRATALQPGMVLKLP